MRLSSLTTIRIVLRGVDVPGFLSGRHLVVPTGQSRISRSGPSLLRLFVVVHSGPGLCLVRGIRRHHIGDQAAHRANGCSPGSDHGTQRSAHGGVLQVWTGFLGNRLHSTTNGRCGVDRSGRCSWSSRRHSGRRCGRGILRLYTRLAGGWIDLVGSARQHCIERCIGSGAPRFAVVHGFRRRRGVR